MFILFPVILTVVLISPLIFIAITSHFVLVSSSFESIKFNMAHLSPDPAPQASSNMHSPLSKHASNQSSESTISVALKEQERPQSNGSDLENLKESTPEWKPR